MVADRLTAEFETESDVGGVGFPTAPHCQLFIELIGLVTCAVHCRRVQDRWREDPGAIQFAATPQHFGESEYIRSSRVTSDPRHLRSFRSENPVGAEVFVAQVYLRKGLSSRLVHKDWEDVAIL